MFDQPFTDGTCLYYSYAVEQYVETKRQDKDGNVETDRSWQTTSSHRLAAPFYLDDGTGSRSLLVAIVLPVCNGSDARRCHRLLETPADRAYKVGRPRIGRP